MVSAAEALHGRYHQTLTVSGTNQENDTAIRTDCLRTGDSCMSYSHAPPDTDRALVFSSGNWSVDTDYDAACPQGGSSHTRVTADFPLPAPPQDPITLLTGHGHAQATEGSCAGSWDFDQKFVRIGD